MNQSYRHPDTIPPVVYVGNRRSLTGVARAMPPHSHHLSLEICYVMKGHIQWWIGSRSFDLHPNDMVVTLPKQSHGTIDSALQPCDYCWVHIRETQIPQIIRGVIDVPGFHGVHRNQPQTGELVLRILEEHERRDRFSLPVVESLTTTLLASLARNVSPQTQTSYSPLVQKAQALLIDPFDETRSVEETARILGVSTVWLTKKFIEEVGDSPANWARNWKINEARRLLTTDSATVGEIAMRLGFASSQYFATVFRRETGMTPTEYRNITPEYLGH